MYSFTLAVSCCAKTFQANSSSILMSPCLKLLQGGPHENEFWLFSNSEMNVRKLLDWKKEMKKIGSFV